VTRDFPGCVATVGDIVTEPGSYNVVPGRATLQLECRAAEDTRLAALELALTRRARAEAEALGLDVTVESVGRWEPAPTDPAIRALIAAAASALGLTTMQVPSGAGHDAQSLAAVTPSGMVFVPSAGGISHEASEHTAWEDCVNGANVLLHATVRLAQAEQASG
jgi:N-carbamoyl-L-amino-acid hydrolase